MLYGALGGRLDHTFAAFQTLAFSERPGAASGVLVDGHHWVTMLENQSLQVPDGIPSCFHLSRTPNECSGIYSARTELPAGGCLPGSEFPARRQQLGRNVSRQYLRPEGRLLVILSALP